MTVREFYRFLEEQIPSALSCAWDNDGLMCCPDENARVDRVLIALDITGRVIEEAIAGKYDVILSHHPLIFSPLKSLSPADPVARKVIKLLRAGITAMSFHTRLDAVEGGVNDVLAAKLGLQNVEVFGENGEAIGRIGTLSKPMELSSFAALVKEVTDADAVQISSADRPVCRVAVLGGSGSSDVEAAIMAGADTYLSGELKHNYLTDAPDLGINLVAAGHFHTEDPVCCRLRELALTAEPTLQVTITNSNPVRFI